MDDDIVARLKMPLGWYTIEGVDVPMHPAGEIDFLLEEAAEEIERLRGLINSPVVDDWLEGVRLEAAHQRERWPSESDDGKTDADWFWLVGYLAGKALFAIMQGNVDKAKHHTISTGAALLNWWRHICGEATGMRPGIDPPGEGNNGPHP